LTAALPEGGEPFEQLRERVTGHVLPGGTFRVAGHERWLSHEAMQSAEVDVPVLHPVWILLGGLRGMGLSMDELMNLARPGPADSVLFGETEVEQRVPLCADTDYAVAGSVVALSRKQGQRSGTLDIMTVRLEISELATGELAAVSSQTYLITRRANARS